MRIVRKKPTTFEYVSTVENDGLVNGILAIMANSIIAFTVWFIRKRWSDLRRSVACRIVGGVTAVSRRFLVVVANGLGETVLGIQSPSLGRDPVSNTVCSRE